MENPTMRLLAFVITCILLNTTSSAQVFEGSEAGKKVDGAQLVRMNEKGNYVDFIRLNTTTKIREENHLEWLTNVLNLPNGVTLQLSKTTTDPNGYRHYRYKEYYNGIPVEYGNYYVHTKNGLVESANCELYLQMPDKITASVSEDDAFLTARRSVPSTRYSTEPWENLNDVILANKLLLYPENGHCRLAYKFDIYSLEPLKRVYIYIDAVTGSKIAEVSRIHTSDTKGTAVTAYNGTVTMTTDSLSATSYLLRANKGFGGLQTLNLNNGNNFNVSTDFTDSDNIWDTAAIDRYAYDVHYGTEATYDWYLARFGRNSYDDSGAQLKSYVHFSSGYVNAFWDGSRMVYGDGDGINFTPLTSLDIVGHEITHAVTEYSADLVYANEPGALNESFSDCFGITIDFFKNPSTADFLCGENVNINGIPFRSMSNPKQYNNPDCYGGLYWNAPLEVHNNSGVQNYWYYLLCQGGTGVNDLGNYYTVDSIGMTDASAIAYRSLTVYLTPNSNYADARFYSIQAAADLFGACSNQVIQVTNAWHAVGVGDLFSNAVVAGFTSSKNYFCAVPSTVYFYNNSFNATSFLWDFGDGTTSTDTAPSHTYTLAGTFTVTLIASGTGTCANADTMVLTNYLTVLNGSGPLSSACVPATISPCCGVGILQVNFNTISKYSLNASEGYQDFTCGLVTTVLAGNPVPISIKTGTTTNENVKVWIDYNNDGQFSNTTELAFSSDNKLNLHNGIINNTANAATGIPLRMRVMDDQASYAVTDACNNPLNGQAEDYAVIFISNPLPPIADFTANVTTVKAGSFVQFTDLTQNGPTSWAWNFPGGIPSSSTMQNPSVQYIIPGIYPVSFSVTNSLGTDSITKINYIRVVYMINMCSGTDTIIAPNGQLFDSGGPTGNYSDFENCSILIDPGCASSVSLSFSEFNSDYCCDHLYIYDGNSAGGTLLYDANGSGVPPFLTASSGKMFISWQSDGYGISNGFSAYWTSVTVSGSSPVAGFGISHNNPPAGVPVQFSDQTTDQPYSWIWDFGDGQFDYIKNPTHTYQLPGVYTVTLIAKNCVAFDTISQTINVQSVPVISINPNSIIESLPCNDSIVVPLTIYNTGPGDMIFNINGNNSQSPVRILSLIYATNSVINSIYNHTKNAVTAYFTNCTWDSTGTMEPSVLQAALVNKDVLLLPEYQLSIASSIYASLATVVQNFASSGGTVIVCGSTGSANRIYDLGLFTGNYGNYLSTGMVNVLDSTDDMMDHVPLSFAITNGTIYHHITNIDKVKLAGYTANDVVTYRNFGKGKAVYIGFNYLSYTPETQRIISNSIRYAKVKNLPGWIGISPLTGTVNPGDSAIISVTLSSSGLNTGTYNGTIAINSNDTLNPAVNVPVHLSINGPAKVNLSDTSLSFGTVAQYSSAHDTITFSNTGCDTLHITSLLATDSAFFAMPASLHVLPGSSGEVVITFNPQIIGSYSALLNVLNNDVDSVISLFGTCGVAPSINVIPDSISIVLGCYDSLTVPLHLINNGGSDLSFNINVNSPQTPVRVLTMVYGVDLSASGIYVNTKNAIAAWFSNYTWDTTGTVNPAVLQDALSGKDVLLLPAHTLSSSSSSSAYASLAAVIQNFASSGGTVIVCGSNAYGTENRIYDLGLFKGFYGPQFSNMQLNVLDTTDDIMNNIADTISIPYNTYGQFIKNNDKVKLLEYNGYDILTYRKMGSGKAVYIGFSYASFNSGTQQIISNCVRYAKSKHLPYWIQVSPLAGTIYAGDSVATDLIFNSSGLNAGIYDGTITVNSNDPLNPVVSVPLHVVIDGPALINLPDTCINFGGIMQYTSAHDTVLFSNTGCDTLHITSMVATDPAFIIQPTTLNIPPGDSATVVITFTPQSSGTINSLLHILNNDADTVFCLSGIGITPPSIEVHPDSIHTVLNCHDSITVPVWVVNNGNTALSFINSVNISQPPVRILTMTYGVDTASAAEYSNTKNSISAYFSNYTWDTTGTTNPSELQSALSNKDVLLLPAHTLSVTSSIYASLDMVIQNFASSGGTVIVCGSTGSISENRIYDLGLFSGYYSSYINGGQINATNINDDFMDSVPLPFTATKATMYHKILNFDKVMLIYNNGWSDNYDIVTYRNIGSGKAIYMGFDYNTFNPGTQRIISNCIQYSNRIVYPDWIHVSPLTGTINPGDSALIYVNLNSSGLSIGSYDGTVTVSSNDPLNPVWNVPVNMILSGTAMINLSDTCINFGSISQYASVNDTISFINTGCDTLHISSLLASDSAYTVLPSSIHVPPYSSGQAVINFHPQTAGNFSTLLNVLSNVGDTIICLTGTGFPAPSIEVNPDSVSVVLSCNDSISVPVWVLNNGGSDLTFSIDGDNSQNPVRVLAMTYGVNMSASGEYIHTKNGITASFTNYTWDTTGTTNPVVLQAALADKDVLLLPAHELSATSYHYTSLAAIVQNFASSGGTVIVCGSAGGNSGNRIYNLGLFTGYYYTGVTGYQISVLDTSNNIMDSVPLTLAVPLTTYLHNIFNADKVKLAEYFGYDVVTYRNIGSGKAIYIGFNYNAITPGIQRIISNCIRFAKRRNLPAWVGVSQLTGTVTPGDSVLVYVTINTSGLSAGIYDGNIAIHSNDPLNPKLNIPVHLVTSGPALINFSEACVNFDTIRKYGTAQHNLLISNTGCDTLHITSLLSSDPSFSVVPATSNIPPGDTIQVVIHFNPQTTGSFNAVLNILNNDADTVICLLGTSIDAPSIGVQTDSISVTIGCSDSLTVPVYLVNNGGSSLSYNINGNNQHLPVRVLTMIYGVDMSPGGEYVNTKNAISAWFSNYTWDTTGTTNPYILQSALSNKDVLILPEHELPVTSSFYNSLATVIQNFASAGGTVIVCGSTGDNSESRIYDIGLFTGNYKSSVTLGQLSVTDTTNDIMDGIPLSITAPNSTIFHTITNTDKVGLVKSGNNDAVTYRNIGSGKAVYLGFDYFLFTLQTQRIISNCVRYANNRSLPGWVQVSPLAGTINPGDSALVYVTVNSSGWPAGTHHTTLAVHSNDPSDPVVSVPVQLVITGAVHINLSGTCVDFDTIMQHTYAYDTISILNSGCDTLHITSMLATDSSFTITPSTLLVPPYGSGQVLITFHPQPVGTFNALFNILNNDVDTVICLSGTAFAAPSINVDPDAISMALNCNDSITVPVWIVNNGGSDMTFNLNVTSLPAPVRILTMIYGVDMYATSSYFNTKNAISAYFSNYTWDTTGTTNPLMLQAQLADNDVLLMPAHELASSSSIYTGLSAVVQNFAAAGGTVIVCGSSGSSSENRIYDLGLFSGSFISNINIGQINVLDTTEDIMNQVPQIIPASYITYYHNISNSNKVKLAEFNNYDVVTYRNIGLGKAIYIGYDYISYTAESQRIVSNCVSYANNGKQPYCIQLTPLAGTVTAGDSVLIYVTLNTTALSAGVLDDTISIHSNDPLNPVVNVPVHMVINGTPLINLSDTCADFGSIVQYNPAYDTISFSNTGCDTLRITAMLATDSAFTVIPATINIPPYGSGAVVINFHPQTVGSFNGVLNVLNNDADTVICLSGVCVAAPSIVIHPDSVSASLSCNDSLTIPVWVVNGGGTDLTYTISGQDAPSIVRVLAMTYGVDMSPTGEYTHTKNAISAYFSNYSWDSTVTTNSSVLQAALTDKDVLLLPEHESSVSSSVYASLATVVQNFVSSGGTVIVCGSDGSLSENRIYDLGLFSGLYFSSTNTGQINNLDTTDIIMDNVPLAIPATNSTFYHYLADTGIVKLAQYNGYDVVSYRKIGLGKVIYTGFDYDSYTPETQRIISNCVRNAGIGSLPGWIKVSLPSATLSAGDSVLVNVTFYSNGLAAGTYTTDILFNSNDPVHGQDSLPVTFNIGFDPCAGFTDSIPSPCNGTVVFTDNTLNSPTSWHWDFGDGDTSVLQSPLHNYLLPGIYPVTLIAGNSYGSDTVMQNVTVQVINAGFTISGNAVVGQSLIFTPSAPGAISYSWSFGDSSYSSLINPSHIYASPGTYIISLLVSNGVCSATVYDTLIVLLTQIAEFDYHASLLIVPNPFQSEVIISYTLNLPDKVSLSVVDMTGKLIDEILCDEQQSPGKFTYKFSTESSGIYFVKFKTDSSVSIRKIVKMK